MSKKDLPGMPARDEVGEAAAKLVAVVQDQKRLLEKKGDAQDDLCNAMIKNKRSSVTVEGVTFILQQKEAEERVRIVWPR